MLYFRLSYKFYLKKNDERYEWCDSFLFIYCYISDVIVEEKYSIILKHSYVIGRCKTWKIDFPPAKNLN